MNILYLTDPGVDYLPDLLYTGLCKMLGWAALIDYPWKLQNHDPSAKLNFMPQNPGQQYQQEDVISLLAARRFDLVVLSAPRGHH